jgi:hypothetical protein
MDCLKKPLRFSFFVFLMFYCSIVGITYLFLHVFLAEMKHFWEGIAILSVLIIVILSFVSRE